MHVITFPAWAVYAWMCGCICRRLCCPGKTSIISSINVHKKQIHPLQKIKKAPILCSPAQTQKHFTMYRPPVQNLLLSRVSFHPGFNWYLGAVWTSYTVTHFANVSVLAAPANWVGNSWKGQHTSKQEEKLPVVTVIKCKMCFHFHLNSTFPYKPIM